MHITNDVILFGALLLLISIVASAVSSRLGAPMLLGFLVLGMLAGEDGPGGIQFDDIYASQLVGCVALVARQQMAAAPRLPESRQGLTFAASLLTAVDLTLAHCRCADDWLGSHTNLVFGGE